MSISPLFRWPNSVNHYRDVISAQRKSNKYTGKFADLADTQRIIEEQNEGKPWNKIFSSDINTYGQEILDEIGVGKIERNLSKLGKWGENMSVFNRAARKDQANRIAAYGEDVKKGLNEDIEAKTKEYVKAADEFSAYRRQNNISNLAEGIVLRKRADAHGYGVANLESLGEQIKLARKGNLIDVDKFTNAMYNAQMRKFVANQGDEALMKAQDLKDTARRIKLMGSTASGGNPWSEGLNISGLSLIATDEIAEQAGKSILGAGIATLGSAIAGGYGLKRAIDGAINSRLAEASRLLRQDSKIDAETGQWIQKNLKVEIDDQIEQWASEWQREHPNATHIPLDEMHKEVDKVVKRELVKLKAIKDLPEWLIKGMATRATAATLTGNTLFD
ncbi:hypothetical protein UXP73_02525 [Enterobacter hormaechei]